MASRRYKEQVILCIAYSVVQLLTRSFIIENSFNLASATLADLDRFQNILSNDEYDLIKANISDRDILLQARQMFENAAGEWSEVKFGALLNDHFYNLQKYKQISTKKIDRMVEICLENGAWGAKINGSGGKSCIN